MRKIYSSLLVLAMLLVGTVAKAQYTVVIESDPIEGYVAGQQSFDAAEIAQALGLADAAALKEFVDGNDAVYLGIAEGKSNAYTGNHNEFWMNLAGEPQGYSADGTSWFAGIEVEAAGTDEETGETWNDRVNVYVGQMPGVFKKIYEASELKAMLYLVNGENEVSFDVTQKVTAAPQPTLAEPTKILSQLTIVKDYELALDFTYGKQYEGKTYSATLDGIYDALGVTAAEFDASVADYVFTSVVHVDSIATEGTEKIAVYSVEEGEMKLPADAAGGAWFGRYSNYDEINDVEEYLPISLPKAWGANCTFYTQDIKLADGVFSILSGQYPGTFKEGDTDYTYLYIVVGDKAARVKVQVSIEMPESLPFEEMTKVGETSVEITSPANNDYSTKPFTVDMEAICAALGCEPSDIDEFYAFASEGELSDNHTTSGGGYYFNQDGYIDSWGNKAPVYIDPSDLPNGKYEIGQYAGVYSEITEPVVWTTQLILQYANNYYVINVQYTINPPKQVDEEIEFTLKATETLAMQIIPSDNDWAYGIQSTIDLDYVESMIGTKEFTLYTDKWDADKEELVWSKKYTCTPNPGFWYGTDTYEDSEHRVVVDNAGWGTNSFGVTYSAGTITWYQYPGQRSVGDAFTANLYLVNEETGDYMQYILRVSYVTDVAEIETVGEEDFSLVMTDDKLNENDFYAESVSLAAAFEALGITAEEYDGCEWFVLGRNGDFVSPEEVFNDPDNGSSFTALGGNVSSESADAVFVVGMDDYKSAEGEYYFFASLLDGDPTEETVYTTKAALRYESKQYIFTIVIGGSQNAVGINTVSENMKSNKVYDLSGRQVKNPAKGLYIMNGKTYFVK